PSAELLAEIVRAVALAGARRQQCQMADRRAGDDRRQLAMHRDSQGGTSLLLAHGQHAIANVLASDADHVAAPLCRVESERHCGPRFRADRMVRLELRDLVLGPSVVSVRPRRLESYP